MKKLIRDLKVGDIIQIPNVFGKSDICTEGKDYNSFFEVEILKIENHYVYNQTIYSIVVTDGGKKFNLEARGHWEAEVVQEHLATKFEHSVKNVCAFCRSLNNQKPSEKICPHKNCPVLDMKIKIATK